MEKADIVNRPTFPESITAHMIS